MKYRCRVIGHEIKETKGAPVIVVKYKGYDHGCEIKGSLIVAEEDRVKYPFGCSVVIDFTMQQEMQLEK